MFGELGFVFGFEPGVLLAGFDVLGGQTAELPTGFYILFENIPVKGSLQ